MYIVVIMIYKNNNSSVPYCTIIRANRTRPEVIKFAQTICVHFSIKNPIECFGKFFFVLFSIFVPDIQKLRHFASNNFTPKKIVYSSPEMFDIKYLDEVNIEARLD